ncbi:MAG: DUF2786 domain-containing protein [Frankiaceae bacterium]
MNTRTVGEKALGRIVALLAKAESTDSTAEADALVTKAQQLATLHAIDLAFAEQERTGREHRHRETPEQRVLTLGEPGRRGSKFLVSLLVAIAASNDVRCDVARNSTYAVAFGMPGDLDVCEALLASLSAQMALRAATALQVGEHRRLGVDARVYRSSFYAGFVAAIAVRLAAARAEAVAGWGCDEPEGPVRAGRARWADTAHRRAGSEANGDVVAGADTGGEAGAAVAWAPADGPPAPSAQVVLRDKAEQVHDFYAARSQARGSWRPSAARRDGRAWRHGRKAGERASLGPQPELGGARRSLRR